MERNKDAVKDFWERASCGEELYLDGLGREDYREQARVRYELEPYIDRFAAFGETQGKRVLEIGVGLGADHQRFAEAGAILCGIDLTQRAVDHVDRRLKLFGLHSQLARGDAERLVFPHDSFDYVYSWGVIHHSPNTPAAVAEIHRVLKPGGIARIMIYHKWSLVGYMLWLRYALLRGKPLLSLSDIYDRYLESPGTKAYSVPEAREMFKAFNDVQVQTVLTHGDLLESAAGQRHRGLALSVARAIWPRRTIRWLLPHHGLFMLISATK